MRLSDFQVTGRGAYDEARFLVELQSEALSARSEVPDIVSTAWLEFFEDLAGQRKAWDGARSASSAENHLFLSVTCDALGHVEFVVRLRENPLYKGWSAELPLHIELGQLDTLAKQARSFFAV